MDTTSTNECEKGYPTGGLFCILIVWWGANPRSGFTLWQDSQSGRMSDANAPERSEGNGQGWPLSIPTKYTTIASPFYGKNATVRCTTQKIARLPITYAGSAETHATCGNLMPRVLRRSNQKMANTAAMNNS